MPHGALLVCLKLTCSPPSLPPSLALRAAPAFQQADDGRRAVYIAAVDGNDYCVATNDAWGVYYRRPDELMRDMWEKQCLVAFLLVS